MKDSKTGQRSKRYLWRCRDCKRQFTVKVGTVMEDSPIQLRHWCYAFWAACASKKGVSALQIRRMTGLSYKSALFLMHRIRFAMADSPEAKLPRLGGIVEADETFIGGKPRRKDPCRRTSGSVNKIPVIGILQRGDDVRAMPVERLSAEGIRDFIMKNVEPDSVLMTDESNPYTRIGANFAVHMAVKHSAREYARGDCHINTIESFWAIVKRALYGTHHAVSRKHLHRYIAERAFVFNARHMDDGARTVLAIQKAEGRRLLYRDAKA